MTELLNSGECLACKQIAAGSAPWSQRAQARHAVDDGVTNQPAAETAGHQVFAQAKVEGKSIPPLNHQPNSYADLIAPPLPPKLL